MDNAQMAALLKSFNAADTPDNTNKIRNAYASDPTAMDRRLFGVKGQSDESGGGRDAILDAMLEKFVAQTAAPPVNEPLPVSPMVQNATAPTRRSATAGASTPSPASQTREQYGPGGSDPLAREVNRVTPRNPNARPPVDSNTATSGYEVDPQQSAQSGTGTLDGLDGILPLIVGLVGAGAASRVGKSIPEATFAGPMNKEITPSGDRVVGKTERLPQGQRQIGNSAPSDVLNSPNARAAIEAPAIPLDNRAPSTVTGSPENEQLARRAQIQAELDAANAEGNAIQQQMLKGKKAFSPKGAIRNVTGRK